MGTLEKAIEIAVNAHRHQKEKAGAPYILHLIRVMGKGNTEIEKVCGVLHDLVEDTDWTFDQLEGEGFSKEIIDVLKCVTKESEEEDYDHFIGRVKQNKTAINVKINDLQDNMDITRLTFITERDRVRLNKYLKAYRELLEIRNEVL
jgi:(p)ppGpp synthase/HD superfamily hydrolase